jgi:hypothetical protein
MLVGRLPYSVVMCCITFYSPSTGGEWFIIYYYSPARCATLTFIQQALCDPVLYSPSSVAGTTSPSTYTQLFPPRAFHIFTRQAASSFTVQLPPCLAVSRKGQRPRLLPIAIIPPNDGLLHITSIE